MMTMNDRPITRPARVLGGLLPDDQSIARARPASCASRTAGVLLLACAGLAVPALAQPAAQPQRSIPTLRTQWGQSFGGERVFAKPSRDAAMGFSLSTEVLAVNVRPGQRVTAGQVLIRGDDREEASRFVQQTHRADSVLQIDRAKAAAALARREYEQTLETFNAGGGNQLELDRARLTMETSDIDVLIAEWSQQQEKYLAELTQARVERFRLTAPFDGVVDSVSVDIGDAVRETDPVVRVVDLSELWMDVPTPPSEVLRLGLKDGSPAWVMIELGERPIVARGQVINVTPTADGASGKQTVRVSVTNTGNWPSGLDTWVRFTEPGSEWLEMLTAEAEAADGGSAQLGLAWPAPSIVSQSLADTALHEGPARGGGGVP